MTLFPYQERGRDWLKSRRMALLADDMGLGKTAQALSALSHTDRVLVVCPAIAKGVWQREALRWSPHLNVIVLSGKKSFKWPSQGELLIINYDILPSGFFPAPEGTRIIADEAHALKCPKSIRTRRAKALIGSVIDSGGSAWALTATPLLNRPMELWTLLDVFRLAIPAFGHFGRFFGLFGGRKTEYGTEWDGPSSPKSVAMALDRVMLRRKKEQVLDQLPPIRRVETLVSLTKKQGSLIDSIVETFGGFEAFIKALESGVAFEGLSRAMTALAIAKIPAMLEAIEGAEGSEEPLIVFSSHRAPIDIIEGRDGWRTITGDTSPEDRTAYAAEFQSGSLKGIAGTIPAMGTAITLTRSTNVLFVDRTFTPALNDQAEARAHRIGQTGSVLITYLVADHPIDRRVAQLLSLKQSLINNSIEAKSRPKMTWDEARAWGMMPTADRARLEKRTT